MSRPGGEPRADRLQVGKTPPETVRGDRARDLQGAGQGPWRPHPRRERRARRGARSSFTLPLAEGGDARAKTSSDAGRTPGEASAELGESADLIRARRPQLVLLDLMPPGTGGIEPMAEIPELSDLPAIFISGYGRDESDRTPHRALSLSASAVVVARRRAAHASRSGLRYRTRLPKR